MTTHFANSTKTACDLTILGYRQMVYEGEISSRYSMENINHTTLIEEVNCQACRASAEFKLAKVENGKR